MHFKKIIFCLLIVCGVLFACSPTSHIPVEKSLIVKNEIKTDTVILAKEKFEKYLKQKPNRKILGFIKFHLGVYNLGNSGKDSKFKSWLRSIGEEPVLLDSQMIERSKEQIKLFLFKNGFFYATVTDSIRIRKKKATVEYNIIYGPAYTIRNLNYFTLDSGISPLMNAYQNNSLIISGKRYDDDIIEKERERITTDLKDKGYYFFNRNFITFQIDTSLGTHQADINLYLNRINENVTNTYAYGNEITDHQTYKLRNIYIQTDYNPKDPSVSIPNDTTIYNSYYILSTGKYRVLKDNVLVNNFFIKTGDRYLQRDLDMTYRRLQELNIFKFINLYFKEVPRDENQKEYLLDIQIQLTPMDKQDFTEEFEVTNTGSNIGIAGSFGYRNKNTFRGAEVFELKLKGGLEDIPNTNTTVEKKRLFVFNTYVIGPEASLKFKKLLGFGKISRYSNPSTTISVGYNHQNSPDYIRSISNFGFGWALNLTSRQRLIFSPLEINSVVVDLSPPFQKKLDDLNDPQLRYAYDTHIITSARVSWSTTNKTPGYDKDFVFLRVNTEFAYPAFNQSFNRRFKPSQFVKLDYDFSYYHKVNTYNVVITRLAMGYGYPYGNSLALPFEKSYFAGGANSVRAWYTRTLGPGSYKKNIDIEQSGDIKIESNIEYRTELVEFTNGIKLEGAAFVDAGNVWTGKEDKSRPGSKFEVSNFINELGVGSGLGLRFNFTFFIFRLDAAVKLRDPSLDKSNRWVYPNQKFVIGDITANLAIGYPF